LKEVVARMNHRELSLSLVALFLNRYSNSKTWKKKRKILILSRLSLRLEPMPRMPPTSIKVSRKLINPLRLMKNLRFSTERSSSNEEKMKITKKLGA
jgi:hypothetical protein